VVGKLGDVLWEGVATLPISVVDSTEDVLTPIGDDDLLRPMSDALKVRAAITRRDVAARSELSLRLEFKPDDCPGAATIAAGFACDVLHHDHVVATARLTLAPRSHYRISNDTVGRTTVTLPTAMDTTKLEAWTLRLRGDSEHAVLDFGFDDYWAGEFAVPLADVFVPAAEFRE